MSCWLQVTAQEVARRWAALQLRPEAALLVGRFAVETSELLRVELLRCPAARLTSHLSAAQGDVTRYDTTHGHREPHPGMGACHS